MKIFCLMVEDLRWLDYRQVQRTIWKTEEGKNIDDFYAVCREKLKNAADPTVTINELMSLSLQDVSKTQLTQFAEQAVTLLSLYFQSVTRPSQETVEKFRDLRQLLNQALDSMEQIMEASQKYPPPQRSPDEPWW